MINCCIFAYPCYNCFPVAGFAYDALGRRVRKEDHVTTANTRLYYYSDNWQVLSEYDGTGAYKKSYVYGFYTDND